MSKDFRSARFWAQEMLEDALCPGSVAVDATMGNGHDTLWLCRQCGESGRVYAFDVQPQAVENTRRSLADAGLLDRARLFCTGHQHMAQHVTEKADVIMFNLGWLPGAEHGVTTLRETTLAAAEAALSLLKEEGLLTICIYPGHEEGAKELDALLSWGASLDAKRFDVLLKTYLNQPGDPPRLLAIRKKKGKQR